MLANAKWPSRLLKIFLIVVFLLILLRLAAPTLVSWSIVNWFENQQMHAEIEKITIDVSAATFSVFGLAARDDSHDTLKLDELTIGWSWSDLMDSIFRVNRLKLEGLKFDIEAGANGPLVLAGIDVSKQPATDTQSSNKSAPPGWKILLDELELQNIDVCYRQQEIHDYCVNLGRMSWRGNFNFDLQKSDRANVPVYADGEVNVENFVVRNNRLQRELVFFERLQLAGLAVDTEDSIALRQLSLSPLTLMSRPRDDYSPQVTRIDKVTVDEFRLEQRRLATIAKISVKDQEAVLVTDREGRLELQEWLISANDESTEKSTTAGPADASFQFALEDFEYRSEKPIEYLDHSKQPPLKVSLNQIEIRLKNIDSRQPEQDSPVYYSAKYGEHGEILIEGTARPLLKKPTFNLDGHIKGLDLRNISAFTQNSIGHTIKSGQLDADLKMNAQSNVLDSRFDLKLHHFELKAVSEKDRQEIDASLGLPLNASLSLLRDSDNTIRLDIPVTGDLDNPDFDVSNVIAGATSDAITAAVINYYTPFGLVFAVGGLIDLATALRFEPIEFQPANSAIDSASATQLTELVKLMTERPGVRLTLCGFTGPADRQSLFPETPEIPADQLALLPEQSQALVELGEARSANVKQYLVDRKVDASRLIICAAEHQEGEDIAPRVEISI